MSRFLNSFGERFPRTNNNALSREQAQPVIDEQGVLPPNGHAFEDDDFRVHTFEEGMAFYKSKEWKEFRQEFLTGRDLVCCSCDIDLHLHPRLLCVDHIEPLRWNWWRRLHAGNLQVMCKECNELKGNQRIDDFSEISKRVVKRRQQRAIEDAKRATEEAENIWRRSMQPLADNLIKAWDDLRLESPTWTKCALTRRFYLRSMVWNYVNAHPSGTEALIDDTHYAVGRMLFTKVDFAKLKKWYTALPSYVPVTERI